MSRRQKRVREDHGKRSGSLTGPACSPHAVKCDRVKELLQGLAMVLEHHRTPVNVIQSMKNQFSEYLQVPSEGEFLKRAKYLMLWPMAHYLKNEEPPAPATFKPRGVWYRWSRQRLRFYSRRNTHLWYSFLQGKRAAAPVSKGIVLDSYRKHREQMQCPDPLENEDELLDEILEIIEPVLRKLSNDLGRDLKTFFANPGEECHQASIKASFASSRKDGGQSGEIRRLLGKTESRLLDEELHSMDHRTGLWLKDRKLQSNPVTSIIHHPSERELLSERIDQLVRSTTEIPVLHARIEAVLEPLKVRTISKGPALEYYLGKPVQRAIHSRLRRMNCFRLIGRPFCPTDLLDIKAAQEKIGLGPGENWLSVDYSAATDGLSAKLSGEIMGRILRTIASKNLNLYFLLRGILAPHFIHYPPVDGVELDPVMQENGQLMGSILSFNVLCLANLALYLLVRSRTRPDANLCDIIKAVLVNGDDMVYIGSDEEWELHQELGRKIGLLMSPGKAYKHRRYVNVNSVSVDFDLDNPNSTPEKIGFVNVGLLTGKHKVLGKVSTLSVEEVNSPMCSVMNEILSGSWKGRQSSLLKKYLSRNKTELARETKGRNLFLPISAGGMGVSVPSDFKFFITDKQREWASGLREKYPYLIPDIRPLPRGKSIGTVSDREIDPIRDVSSLERERISLPKGSQEGSKDLIFGFTPYVVRSLTTTAED